MSLADIQSMKALKATNEIVRNKTTWNNATYPLYLGHRGSSNLFAPENTIRAFDDCIGMGADGIEFDTFITRDKKMIVIHDITVDRTTDITGQVNKMDFSDIRSADAGAKFVPTVFSKEKIPTVEEVFNRFGGKTLMLPEIKNDGGISTTQQTEYATNMAKLITEKRLESYVLLQSFSPSMIATVKSINPKIKTCLNVVNTDPIPSIPTILSAGYFAVGMDVTLVTQQLVSDFENAGIKIMVFAANFKISDMVNLLQWGTKYIFVTDDAGFHKNNVNTTKVSYPYYMIAPKKMLGSGFRVWGYAGSPTVDGITFPTTGDGVVGLGIKLPNTPNFKITFKVKTGTINADLTRYLGIMTSSPDENPRLTWTNSNQNFYYAHYKANGGVEFGKTLKGGTVTPIKTGTFATYGSNQTLTLEFRMTTAGFIGFKNVTTGEDISQFDNTPIPIGGFIGIYGSMQAFSLQSLDIVEY